MSDGQTNTVQTSGHPYRVLIAGPAGSGKDSLAVQLAAASGGALRPGPSTSEFYCQRNYGDDWSTALEDFKSDAEGRKELAHLIAHYNRFTLPPEDRVSWENAQLYGEMVEAGVDIIVGIRRLAEVQACHRLRLLTDAVWVRRRVPGDPTLDYGPGDLRKLFGDRLYYLDNRGDLEDLTAEAFGLWQRISGIGR